VQGGSLLASPGGHALAVLADGRRALLGLPGTEKVDRHRIMCDGRERMVLDNRAPIPPSDGSEGHAAHRNNSQWKATFGTRPWPELIAFKHTSVHLLAHVPLCPRDLFERAQNACPHHRMMQGNTARRRHHRRMLGTVAFHQDAGGAVNFASGHPPGNLLGGFSVPRKRPAGERGASSVHTPVQTPDKLCPAGDHGNSAGEALPSCLPLHAQDAAGKGHSASDKTGVAHRRIAWDALVIPMVCTNGWCRHFPAAPTVGSSLGYRK
jgi:hypothetical protein